MREGRGWGETYGEGRGEDKIKKEVQEFENNWNFISDVNDVSVRPFF